MDQDTTPCESPDHGFHNYPTQAVLERKVKNTIIIELPLPGIGCSPNCHLGWRKKAVYQTQAKRDAYWAMKSKLPKDYTPVPIRITVTWYQGRKDILKDVCRPNDNDNSTSCLKFALDGFKEAGLVPNDNHKWVKWGDPVLKREAKEHEGRACVILTIEAI